MQLNHNPASTNAIIAGPGNGSVETAVFIDRLRCVSEESSVRRFAKPLLA
ncbi:hypothetical protein AB3X94_15350 [Paraburkholderia sp. BR10923]